MPRKYYFIIIGLFLFLSCFFAVGVVKRIIKHRHLSRELENILCLVQSKIIDNCTIQETTLEIDPNKHGKFIKKISTVDVESNGAQILSERFASAVRKYQLTIIPGGINLSYRYRITFRSADTIWYVQFHRSANESCVEYRVEELFPSRRVTIILNSKAALELLPLLRNALKDANDVNQK